MKRNTHLPHTRETVSIAGVAAAVTLTAVATGDGVSTARVLEEACRRCNIPEPCFGCARVPKSLAEKAIDEICFFPVAWVVICVCISSVLLTEIQRLSRMTLPSQNQGSVCIETSREGVATLRYKGKPAEIRLSTQLPRFADSVADEGKLVGRHK